MANMLATVRIANGYGQAMMPFEAICNDLESFKDQREDGLPKRSDQETTRTSRDPNPKKYHRVTKFLYLLRRINALCLRNILLHSENDPNTVAKRSHSSVSDFQTIQVIADSM